MIKNNKQYNLNTLDGRTKFALNFFKEKGFTQESAAGIVGNLIAESSINPTRNEMGGGSGRGIAQWTESERWQTFLKFASNRKIDSNSLEAQLRFIIHEMPSAMGQSNAERLKNTTNIEDAARLFMDKYERPGVERFNDRLSHSTRAYRILTETTPTFDRGPKIQADNTRNNRVVNKDNDIVGNTLNQAKAFFKNLTSDIPKANTTTIDQARKYFDSLFEQKEEIKTEKEFSLLDKSPKLIRMDSNGR